MASTWARSATTTTAVARKKPVPRHSQIFDPEAIDVAWKDDR